MMITSRERFGMDLSPPQEVAFCHRDDLRATFAVAMSAMYKAEVPLYGDLVRIVNVINRAQLQKSAPEERLDVERHGAIRLGTPYELRIIRRMLALIGLFPVDYYDLSIAGLPMHATAFRPIDNAALSKNPFRIFTTLLRPEMLRPEPRQLALSLLIKRNIFSDELLQLIGVGEEQGGLNPEQGERFIIEAMKTFQWHSTAAASHEDYQKLAVEHPILADISSFNSAHINHLTPRTLDIEAAERLMKQEGLAVKDRIEGPPARQNPVLLRQTSFLALQEQISFPHAGCTGLVEGYHKARFGEIEQRGAALTRKGRQLYDNVLHKAQQQQQQNPDVSEMDVFQTVFQEFPDDWRTMLKEGLVFFELRFTKLASSLETRNSCSAHLSSSISVHISCLLDHGIVEAVPITYEDFLPFSAAGIFRSNLQSAASTADDHSAGRDFTHEPFADREGFVKALGCQILDSECLYADIQARSLSKCAKALGVERILVD